MSFDGTQTKKPRTEKQKEASRANGARSRGAWSGAPRDRNAERYDRLAQVLLLPEESRKIFMTLADEFVQSLNPETPVHHLLIGKMLAAHWRQNRLWGNGNSITPTSLADENRLDRQFYRAYDRYFRLKKNFASQNDPSDSFPDTYPPSGTPPEPGETQENEDTREPEPHDHDPGSEAEKDEIPATETEEPHTTADAGYLARPLVDVTQDIIISEDHGGATEALEDRRVHPHPHRRHSLATHHKTNPIRAACEPERIAVIEVSAHQNTAIPVYLSRAPTRHHRSLTTRLSPLAAVCFLWLSGCAKAPDPAPPEAKGADTQVVVAVAKVAPADLEKREVMAAEFRPFQIIDVHARIAGYLKKIYVDVGDRVKEGQDLALLEVPELADELSHAQASRSRSVAEVNRAKEDVARAQAQYQAAHLSYERLAGVAKTRPTLIAQQEIDDAQARDLSAQAAVSAASAALAAAQQTVDVSQSDIEKVKTMTSFTKITAPFAGVVTKRYADTGAMIPAGTASTSNGLALVQLSQNNLLRLVLPVPEALVAKIKLGSAVKVHVGALNRDFEGKVSRFSDTVSMATRTMDTEIDVPNPSLILIPGMYAEATITVEQRPHALAIPLEAVTQTSKGATAYVVDSGGHIAIRNLRLGLETPDRVEVLSGLEAGELVVVGNRSSLVAGQAVVAKTTDAGAL